MAAPFTSIARVVTLNLLRIVTGLLFMQHGVQKLFGMLGGRQVESIASMIGLAGILEFAGGLLIVLGLFTRPVAFVLAGEMAFAYFMAHASRAFWPIMNGGELAALYAFIYLFFAAHGGGDYSLDGWIRSKRAEQTHSVGERLNATSRVG
jgi:putative oxidoreductase